MQELERAARDEWAIAGEAAKEFVALGFITDVSPEGELGDVVWFQLNNCAGSGEFLVEGDEILRVLGVAMQDGRVGGTEGGVNMPRVLWHSHYLAVEPSDADVQEFPGWLVDVGMVYHAPSGQTTLYNHSGVISSTTNVDSASIATGAS